MLKKLEESWNTIAFPRRWKLKTLLCFVEGATQPSLSSATAADEHHDIQQNLSPGDSSTHSTQLQLQCNASAIESQPGTHL